MRRRGPTTRWSPGLRHPSATPRRSPASTRRSWSPATRTSRTTGAVGAVRFVNAGSVGLPYEGDGAARWVWVAGGVPELRRTAYDAAAAGAGCWRRAGPTSARCGAASSSPSRRRSSRSCSRAWRAARWPEALERAASGPEARPRRQTAGAPHRLPACQKTNNRRRTPSPRQAQSGVSSRCGSRSARLTGSSRAAAAGARAGAHLDVGRRRHHAARRAVPPASRSVSQAACANSRRGAARARSGGRPTASARGRPATARRRAR